MSALQVGARVEVRMGARWRVAVVVAGYEHTPGAGTLFQDEPRMVWTAEVVHEDGSRGCGVVLDGRWPVRLVEPGLFREE